jgi:hypothetical protein
MDTNRLQEAGIMGISKASPTDNEIGMVRPTVRILSGPAAGKAVIMQGLIMTIGSDPSCTLTIPDDGRVFGNHARLELRQGKLWIGDVGSPTGTFVNGDPILGMVPVHHGDRVQVGNTTLVIATRGEDVSLDRGRQAARPSFAAKRSAGRTIMTFAANILLVLITLFLVAVILIFVARYFGWPLPAPFDDLVRQVFSLFN